MSKKELAKRYALFILGLLFSGIGVAFTKHGELGVSPVSSVANVMSYKFDFFSMGAWLIIWNCVLIVGQIVGTREGTILSAVLTGFVVKFFTKLLKKKLDRILTK